MQTGDSDFGKTALASNPDRIDVQLLLREPSFREFYKGDRGGEDGGTVKDTEGPSPNAETTTPEEQIEAAFQAVQSALRADLLERIGQNSPAFFEQLIVDLLVAMGYGGSHKNAAAQTA